MFGLFIVSIGIIAAFAALFFWAVGEMFQNKDMEQLMIYSLVVLGVSTAIVLIMVFIQWLTSKFKSSRTE